MKKNLIFACILSCLGISSIHAMSIQLHEMDQYASGIYGSFSGNQYGIDTGIIEFPDTIRVVSQEKSKRIYHNPARLPSREQFSQDIQNGAEGMKEINRLLE